MWISKICRFVGRLYISKLIPVIGKLIETHLIIRLLCQGHPRPLKRGLRAPDMWICKVWRIVSMLYIGIDPSDGETHWNTSYHSINICYLFSIIKMENVPAESKFQANVPGWGIMHIWSWIIGWEFLSRFSTHFWLLGVKTYEMMIATCLQCVAMSFPITGINFEI